MKNSALSSLLIFGAHAFPFVPSQAGVDSTLIGADRSRIRRQQPGQGPGSAAQCPFNAAHKPAAPFNPKYPYNSAKNGQPGKGQGGFLVPAIGDDAHKFIAPGPNDIRGPCPGLNTLANHNFLARDGITTYAELVDAQQNVYNVGYDLANLLAVLGLTLTDGDLVTEKLSIGCDATTRTSFNPALTGSEPGLDGHNKFEADTSLTRNDFFTHGGDNYKFNGTLFRMMTETTGGIYNLQNLALYRYQRYQQSLVENPNFYFGPFSLLLFGAASFLYELMPSGTHNYAPDKATISSFFGAQDNGDGTYSFNNAEQIPPNWTNRVAPYSNFLVGSQIIKMYLLHPVPFGGSVGDGTFVPSPDWNFIKNGTILNGNVSPTDASCLLYMLATERVPSYFNSVVTPTVETLSFVLKKLTGLGFDNLGCPQPLT